MKRADFLFLSSVVMVVTVLAMGVSRPIALRAQAQEPERLPSGVPAIDPNGPGIFTAIQEQLGLKLVPSKARTDVIVVDSIERPTPD
jgi:uncharacterized protein (TIGR03435 family)